MTELTTERSPEQDDQSVFQAEEAQEILQIAIARHTEEGELTRTQLHEIADEMGIAPETLAAAEQEWQLRKREKADLEAFDEFRQQRFQGHLIRFAIVNTVFITLNLAAAGRVSWSLYIVLVWGGALGLQAWHTYYPNNQRYREEFEKWRRRQQLKRSFDRFMDWLLGT